MITKEERAEIQAALRLLQLDGDEEVWERVARGFEHGHWRLPSMLYSNAQNLSEQCRRLKETQRNLELGRQALGQGKLAIHEFRARLMVDLEQFLVSDGGGES